MIITVLKNSLLIFLTLSRSLPAITGSSMEAGSSSKSTSLSQAITEARFKICFSPPESESVLLSNMWLREKNEAVSAILLLIKSSLSPFPDKFTASSPYTLSIIIWLSGFCITIMALSLKYSFNFFKSVVLPLPVIPHTNIKLPFSTIFSYCISII